MAIVLCVSVSTIMVGIISAYSAKKEIIEQTNRNMKALSSQYANQMDATFAKYEGVSEVIGTYISATYQVSWLKGIEMSVSYYREIESYIEAICRQYPELLSIYTYMNPEKLKSLQGTRYEKGIKVEYDPYDEYTAYKNNEEQWQWFHDVEQSGKPMWSDSKVNPTTGEEYISYYYPVYIEEQLVAITGVDIPFQHFIDLVDNIQLYETGGALLLNADREIMVDKKNARGESLSNIGYYELEEALHLQDNGFLEMEIKDSDECFVGYENLKNSFVFAVYAPQNEVLAVANQSVEMIIMVIILGLIISVMLAIGIGVSISKPIKVVSKDLKLVGKGDFTGHGFMKYLKKKDETGELARAIKEMQNTMKEMIGMVKAESERIGDSATELNDSVVKLADKASGISAVSEEIAAGMEETASTADLLSNSSTRMQSFAQDMKEKSKSGNETSAEIAKRAVELIQESQNSVGAFEEWTLQAQVRLEEVIEESKQVEDIKELTKAIMKIATETNLLSLNASIEAARAGEFGKGFAVVAQEIRLLAENSQHTAKNIQEITTNVVDIVRKLNEYAKEVLGYTNTHVMQSLNSLIGASKQYLTDAGAIETLISEFHLISNHISEEAKVLNEAFYHLKSATAEGAQGSNELSKSAEDVLVNSNSVSEQSNQLTEVSQELRDMTLKFQV